MRAVLCARDNQIDESQQGAAMRRTSRSGSAVYLGWCVALAVGAAACSGESNQLAPVSFDSSPPPPSVTVADAASTTQPPPSSAATTTTFPATSTTPPPPSTTDGLTGPMFSDALGVKVDSAPGVRTRGDTRRLLDEGVYVHIAWEPDPTDASVFTVQPDDIAILEAYAMAQATYYRAAMGQITTDHPDFDKYIVGGGRGLNNALEDRRRRGKVLSVGSGVLLRPYVLGDNRTDKSAIILDCTLHNEQEIDLAGGNPVLADLHPQGQFAVMAKTDEGWKVERVGLEPGACL